MPIKHELDSMFYPRSVAVVGASSNPLGWGGTNFMSRLRKVGFSGNIYPVNPKTSEIQGLKAYPDLKSIPETVDFVLVAVPAPRVPEVLEDCVAAGAKNVHIFSSGFSETGEEEGRLLDQRITEIIQRGGLRVVGPNCMGVYVPASKLAAWGAEPAGSGPVAFISQSGGHAEFLTSYAQGLGIRFSKVVSFGNARGLQVLDFLEYLADDPDTGIITLYLEGLRDGNKITRLVRAINRTKPVIVWKAGLTASGSRAVASHTGSLGGEAKAWQAFFAQTGAISVGSLEEIADVVMVFLHLKAPRGRHTLLLGGGGGNAVALSDTCSREGLDVAPISEQTRRELARFIPLAGNIIRNPLDVWRGQDDVDLLRRTVEVAVADPAIDLVIFERHFGTGDYDRVDPAREQRQRKVNDFIIEFARNNNHSKPVVVVLKPLNLSPESVAAGARMQREFAVAGVPAYSSQSSAARALSRFIGYHEFQAKGRETD